jgi:hypothetical protein
LLRKASDRVYDVLAVVKHQQYVSVTKCVEQPRRGIFDGDKQAER